MRCFASGLPLAFALILIGCGAGSETKPVAAPPGKAEKPDSAISKIVPPSPPKTLFEPLEALVSRHGFAPQQVGFAVRDLVSGEVLAYRNPHRTYIPASVTKVATAVTALEILGADKRFETRVQSSGHIQNGELSGDLALVGGGDPLLSSADLMAMCRRLHRAGVREVTGRFLVDDGQGLRRRSINRRQPEGARYNPAISPLTVGFNRIRIVHEKRGTSSTATAYAVPPLPGVDLALDTRQSRNDAPWRLAFRPEGVVWRLNPEASPKGAHWVPLKRPSMATGAMFRRLCGRLGIEMPHPERDRGPAQGRTLARHVSPPLYRIVAAMLEHSNNLVAELVGTAATQALTGRILPLNRSSAAVARWWQERLPEHEWPGFRPGNHSGLTARGRMTPAQMAAILEFADGRFYEMPSGTKRSLLSLLPAAGTSGAFGGRLDWPATALSVWAKTGTMHFASGLAGYLLTSDGRRLAFAIFVTDREQRLRYNPQAEAQPKGQAARIADWRRRAKALEAELVRRWAHRN